MTFALPHHELERHPLVALVRPTASWKANVKAGRLSPSLYEPRSPRREEAADAKARLEAAYRAMREAHARPNVVLVVLESVGSEQMFGDAGRLSPEITPFLHEMQSSSVHLPNVYAAHPATTGDYTAGPKGAVTDIVKVTDAAGNARTVAVEVGKALRVTPETANAKPGVAISFEATGGSGTGFVWTLSNNLPAAR